MCRKWFCEQVYLVLDSLIGSHYAKDVHQLVISITIVTNPLEYVNFAKIRSFYAMALVFMILLLSTSIWLLFLSVFVPTSILSS